MASPVTPEAERPLYQRLLPGPQRLTREAVLRHQHVRLCGALLATLDRYGYNATTVTTLARLAGVSRRAFYEQFENKENCLLATFDEVANELLLRLHTSAADGGHEPAQRMSAVVEQATSLLARAPRWLLLFTEANRCSAAGAARVRGLVAHSACVLGDAITGGAAAPLPPLLLRGVVAGMHNAVVSAHADGGAARIVDAGRSLADWALPLASPGARELLATSASPRDGAGSYHGPADAAASFEGRVLRAALRASLLREADGGATPATIADEAGVTPEVVLGLYPCMHDCLETARAYFEGAVLSAVESAVVPGDDLPRMVTSALATLLGVVADHVDVVESHASGGTRSGRACADARERSFRRRMVLRALDLAGLPTLTPLQADATVGAIWYLAMTPAARTPAHRLIAAEQLALLALVPRLGAEQAVAGLLAARGPLVTPRRGR